MDPITLTTKDVARLCKVSDATVKRWEEAGLIKSERTSGGHRRFRADEVARFQKDQQLGVRQTAGDETVMTAASRRRFGRDLSDSELFHSLVAGKEEEVAGLLIKEYLDGRSMADIFGSNTPLFSLTDEVKHHSPDLICISSTIMNDVERLSRDYETFYRKARSLRIPVVLGGRSFEDPKIHARFPADHYPVNFTELVDIAQQAIEIFHPLCLLQQHEPAFRHQRILADLVDHILEVHIPSIQFHLVECLLRFC